MSVSTSQQIARYFNEFSTNEVTFTKDVIRATMLHPKQVFLKILGYQFPCIVYSASLVGAKVIVNFHEGLKEVLKKSNNACSLRFSFLQRDKPDPLSFFVSGKITGVTPYGEQKPDLQFVNIQYTQRPPDDLIEIIGGLLEANVNAKRRKEERIVITNDSLNKLGIGGKGAVVVVDGIPRKCILRDLSFSGAKVIILGVAKFIVNKDATLRLDLLDPVETVQLPGKILRFEEVEGRSDIAAYAVKFEEDQIPMEYKMRLNNYLRGMRKPPISKGGAGGSQESGGMRRRRFRR
ncbi:MAG: PilZN3 domain-containing protein [Alkalispirochaetaceae bacterium]